MKKLHNKFIKSLGIAFMTILAANVFAKNQSAIKRKLTRRRSVK